MAISYLGTQETFTGIPSLLLSDLGRVQDITVQRALYQIQNFCNSIGAVSGTLGTTTPTLGTQCPAVFTIPATWTRVSFKGSPAWMPVWV